MDLKKKKKKLNAVGKEKGMQLISPKKLWNWC